MVPPNSCEQPSTCTSVLIYRTACWQKSHFPCSVFGSWFKILCSNTKHTRIYNLYWARREISQWPAISGEQDILPLGSDTEQSVTAHAASWILKNYDNVAISAYIFEVWSGSEKFVWSHQSPDSLFWEKQSFALMYHCIFTETLYLQVSPSFINIVFMPFHL